jgi:outer membrane lipoprotein SlyB
MHISNIKLAVVLLVTIAGTSSTAWAQRAGQSVSIQHGVVTEARSVDLQAEAGGGAMVGGLAGYALSSGRSSSTRARNAILGTAIGAATASATQRSTGMQYTVNTGAGMVVVVSDQREISVGDCVSVENAGTGAANIRRASSALCETADPVSAAVTEHLQEEAADCLAAKDAVLAADTDEDVAKAIRTARISCDS